MHFTVASAVYSLNELAHLSPDRAVLLLTLGLLLIYVELNRPGWILAGALGLLASLFALASLLRLQLNLAAVAFVCVAAAVLLLDLRRGTPWIVACGATFGMVIGVEHLIIGPGDLHVHAATAISCGVSLGAATSILTRIARRARTNKGLD